MLLLLLLEILAQFKICDIDDFFLRKATVIARSYCHGDKFWKHKSERYLPRTLHLFSSLFNFLEKGHGNCFMV